jgi:Cu(I)/Ag(I) efflux system membrane protein CusA/SilA
MQRIAVPMIGGMISSTVLTLVVIPAIYALIKGRGLPRTINDAGETIAAQGQEPAPQWSRAAG